MNNQNKISHKIEHISPDLLKETKCTYITNMYAAGGTPLSLYDILFVIPFEPHLASKIYDCRDALLDDSQSNALKRMLPVWFPCGVIYGKHSKDDVIKEHSHLISLDIDGKANPGMTPEMMKRIVSRLRFVAYAGLSARGKGIFVLVALPEDCENENRFQGYFKALAEAFKSYGLVVDEGCSNRNRGRFLSLDEHPYVNGSAEVWQKCLEPCMVQESIFSEELESCEKALDRLRIEIIVKEAEDRQIAIAPTYYDWFRVGRALAREFGEEGRGWFLRISDVWSKVYGKEHKEDPDKKYSFCLTQPGNTTGIGQFFNIAANAGVWANRVYQGTL